MLDYIWAIMILTGIFYGAATGRMADVTEGALASAGEAVSLCITMMGVVALWMGLMEIAKEAGLIAKLTRGVEPFLNYVFPRIPKTHAAREYIAANIVANVLGLGWACTPAGLKAMEALAELEEERGNPGGIASNEMCNFLILNISSLQLISVNLLAYRSKYGSKTPGDIIFPGILATICSTLVGVIFCKIADGRRKSSDAIADGRSKKKIRRR